MKLHVVQPAKHSECRGRRCKDHFQYHNEYVVSVVEDFLGDQDQDQDQDSFLGDHSRVSPAAVAGAAVHMVCMCCPLLIRVPENVFFCAKSSPNQVARLSKLDIFLGDLTFFYQCQ